MERYQLYRQPGVVEPVNLFGRSVLDGMYRVYQ